MRCITDQGSVVNDIECNSRARPQGSEECNMGPCVTNWYFTSWSKAVSETGLTDVWSSGSGARLIPPFWLSVFGAVRPRGAEERRGVPDPRGGEGGRRRRRVCWGETSGDESLQRGSVRGHDRVVQQRLDTGGFWVRCAFFVGSDAAR